MVSGEVWWRECEVWRTSMVRGQRSEDYRECGEGREEGLISVWWWWRHEVGCWAPRED